MKPVYAQTVSLSSEMTVEQAAHAILQNCLEQLEGNRKAVASGHSPEGVHQMRVGMRRMRSAFRLFQDVLRPGTRMLREIDWLGAELGGARDWDVLGTHLPQGIELNPLRRAVRAHARQLRRAAAETIASKRFDALLRSLHHFIDTSGWRKTATDKQAKALAQPLTKFAEEALDKARKRVARRGKKLKDANDHGRHRLRIAMKKLRYATEFFEDVERKKCTRTALKAMSALQDSLGWLNDAFVADRLLSHFHDTDPGLDQQAGYARGYLAAQLEGRVAQLPKIWKKRATEALRH
jgi:CHAD domain-containing protein